MALRNRLMPPKKKTTKPEELPPDAELQAILDERLKKLDQK
jgi:hypothetical protein